MMDIIRINKKKAGIQFCSFNFTKVNLKILSYILNFRFIKKITINYDNF
jgi:hypothetical protein